VEWHRQGSVKLEQMVVVVIVIVVVVGTEYAPTWSYESLAATWLKAAGITKCIGYLWGLTDGRGEDERKKELSCDGLSLNEQARTDCTTLREK